MSTLEFIADFRLSDPPAYAVEKCHLSLLDLLSIAVAGTATRPSSVIRDHSSKKFCDCLLVLFYHRRSASEKGVALAASNTTDSLDRHDDFNPAKGHIGCLLFPAIFSITSEMDITGKEFLSALLMA